MARTLTLAVVLLAGCDGSDTTVNKVYPNLVVLPTNVDFGDVTVDYSAGVDLQVLNAGIAVLQIDSVLVAGEDSGVFSVDTHGPVSLAKDESTTFHLTFAPETYLPYAAELSIVSNDEDHPALSVPLSGAGAYAPTPDISLSPPSIEFGTVPAGDTSVTVLEVKNEGGSTLTLGTTVQHGSGAFALLGADPSGFSIPAGQSQQLVWQYSPTHDLGDNGSFVIPSNDPDEPEVTVTLLGNGGGDFVYPEAVIDCPTDVAPRERVVLDGRASTSPEPGDLTYAWSLDGIPAGSAVDEIINNTEAVAEFTTDLAGEYTVGLVVTTPTGVASAKRSCKMNAVPREQLHVELSWNTNSADLDLHLIEGDGAFFHEPEDCSYCNQAPAWGASHDIDARNGFGPENINVGVPADGSYRVLVHYFDDHGDKSVVATIRIYTYGVLSSTSTKTMDLNYIWEVGIVNWPAGTVGVTDVYQYNYLYDDLGAFVLDDKGKKQAGPMDCYTD